MRYSRIEMKLAHFCKSTWDLFTKSKTQIACSSDDIWIPTKDKSWIPFKPCSHDTYSCTELCQSVVILCEEIFHAFLIQENVHATHTK